MKRVLPEKLLRRMVRLSARAMMLV